MNTTLYCSHLEIMFSLVNLDLLNVFFFFGLLFYTLQHVYLTAGRQ